MSPLEGSQTRSLRPVPKHKQNKNKKQSVAKKMGKGQTPTNASASYLSPRKMHLLLKGANKKNGNPKNYFFLTFTTPMNQSPRIERFFTQIAGFI